MALWLVLEYEDGRAEEIPVLNGESNDIDADGLLTATVERRWVTSRDDLAERRYRASDIKRVIPLLLPGDRIKVTPEPSSYAPKELQVVDRRDAKHVTAKSRRGRHYNVLGEYWGERNQGDGMPWLRTDDWKSKGNIEQVEITRLVDDDEE